MRSDEVTASGTIVPAAAMLQDRQHRRRRHRDVIAEKIGQQRSPSPIRHVVEMGDVLEPDLLDHELAEGAGAGRAAVDRRGPALRKRDQLLERLHAETGLRREREAFAADHRDMGEVGDRVIADVGIFGRTQDVRPGAGDQQGVAVGIGPHHGGGGDRAPGADAVLDVELLPEHLRQMIGGDAAKPVGRAAGAERNNDLDRPARPLLRRCCGRSVERNKQDRRSQLEGLDRRHVFLVCR